MSYAYRGDEIDKGLRVLGFQMRAIGLLAVTALAVWIVGKFFPTFFVYPYLNWGGFESVWKFWPLFLWCVILTAVVTRVNDEMRTDNQFPVFGLHILISAIAGFWEELGYRWLFICYAMISIVFANWFFGAGLGWIAAVVLSIVVIVQVSEKEYILAGLAAVGVAISVWFALNANIIYWFYEHVIVVIIHFTTFYQMDSVLYNGHDKLFIFGAILANAWFRDGHKYQGLVGVVNAWYGGMILLFATVTYGLFTAIAIHIIYDVIYDVTALVFRRTS